MLLTVAASTATWLLVTFLTPPEDKTKLLSFYRKVRPNAALWGAIAREASDVVPPRDGVNNLLDFAAGCVMVYMVLFGTGNILFGRLTTGIIFLGIAAAAGGIIYRDLNRRGWKVMN